MRKSKNLEKIHTFYHFFKNGTQLCFRNWWAHKSSCRNRFGVCAISLQTSVKKRIYHQWVITPENPLSTNTIYTIQYTYLGIEIICGTLRPKPQWFMELKYYDVWAMPPQKEITKEEELVEICKHPIFLIPVSLKYPLKSDLTENWK